MSKVYRRQYAEPLGGLIEGARGGRLYSALAAPPTNGVAGYDPGSVYIDTINAKVYTNTGTADAATWALLTGGVVGVGAGYKVARGVATITGSGTVVTGLTTVVAVTATMQADASLTNGIAVTATIGDQAGTPAAGSVILKVWKPTASGDVTPIASAAAVAVNWISVGT